MSPTSATVRTWDEFRQRWDGVHNFLLADACVPFAFAMRSYIASEDSPLAQRGGGVTVASAAAGR